MTPDLFFRESGEVEARWSTGCVALYNKAGTRINAGSTCSQGQLAISDAAVQALSN